MNDLAKLLLSIAITFGAAYLGAYFTSWNVEGWYQSALVKPEWTPSGRTIGAVWTALFSLMSISMWLVTRGKNLGQTLRPAKVFLIQLLFNVMWSFIFFGLKKPGWALLDLLVLLVAIGVTIRVFYPISKVSSVLLIPYFLWVMFAGILNFQIWKLN